MKIKRVSYFKDPESDRAWLEEWAAHMSAFTGNRYIKNAVKTSLGTTVVYTIPESAEQNKPIFIFPGYRTSALFWDLKGGLDILSRSFKPYLVETNGQPNLSDGNSPDIYGLDYGHWASEVITAFTDEPVYIAGASFGGLICMKLGIAHPEQIKAAFLVNPAGLRTFSLNFKNVFFNLLPIVSPQDEMIQRFQDEIVLNPPHHTIAETAYKLMAAFVHHAISRHIDHNQKPYYMGEELSKVEIPVHLLLGDADVLFPYKQSLQNAQKYLPQLVSYHILTDMGHGMETDYSVAELIVELSGN